MKRSPGHPAALQEICRRVQHGGQIPGDQIQVLGKQPLGPAGAGHRIRPGLPLQRRLQLVPEVPGGLARVGIAGKGVGGKQQKPGHRALPVQPIHVAGAVLHILRHQPRAAGGAPGNVHPPVRVGVPVRLPLVVQIVGLQPGVGAGRGFQPQGRQPPVQLIQRKIPPAQGLVFYLKPVHQGHGG